MGQSAQTKMKNKKRTNNTTSQDGTKERQLTGPSVTVNLKVSKSESECRAIEVVNVENSRKAKTSSKAKVVLKPEDVSLIVFLLSCFLSFFLSTWALYFSLGLKSWILGFPSVLPHDICVTSPHKLGQIHINHPPIDTLINATKTPTIHVFHNSPRPLSLPENESTFPTCCKHNQETWWYAASKAGSTHEIRTL